VAESNADVGAQPAGSGRAGGRYRWTIAALLFGAATVNYVDRQVIGLLAPTLTRELHWSEADYGVIISWWSIFYGLGAVFMGRLLDRIGVRRGLTIAVSTWSVAAIAHAFVRTVTGFSVARAVLGIGESANFPAAGKAIAEWFPKKERALAFGLFNAGPNVAVVFAALFVPWVTLALGWRWAFVATGTLDLLWLALWLAIYRDPERHPRLTKEELAYIHSDPIESSAPMPWGPLWLRRQTLAFLVGKVMTDPVWFFYLFWLPKFLDAKFGVKLSGLPLPLIVIYSAASAGSIGGGWASGRLIKRGWTVNRARKMTMLVAALAIVPTILAPRASSLWIAIAIVSVAATAHQWWSTNLQTLPSDMYPAQAVASVMGIGLFGSMTASFFFQRATGNILQLTHGDYVPVFAVLGFLYLAALGVIHLLVPRLEAAKLPSA
jgi:ACS family hexuronate transporter-like MFS transporter